MKPMNLADPFVPMSIVDRKFWDGIRAHPAKSALLSAEIEPVEKLPARPPLPSAVDFLVSIRNNDRRRTDNLFRAQRSGLAGLVLRRLNDGPGEDDQLLNWLWDIATQPSWTPAAHTPGRTVPIPDRPVLELVSCDMAMVLAEAREALLAWLDSQSKQLSLSIVREVENRIVKPFGEGAEVWWHPLDDKPGRLLNNWTGVCAGSILAAAMSLERQGFPQPKAIDRAFDALGDFFRDAFTESGECDEGIGYWNYGVEVACFGLCCLSAEQRAKAVDPKRLAQVADYPRRAHLVGRTFFCSNDGNPRNSIPLVCAYWLAEVTDNDFLRWWRQVEPVSLGRGLPQALRALMFMPERADPPMQPPAHDPARFLPDQQVAIFQRSLGGKTVSCTLEGGHNAENHNHNDLGTFQVWLDERVLVPDLGQPEYTSDFFGPKRYSYLVPSSGGHCCPLINGHEQRPGREAAASNVRFSPRTGELSLDLTAAYPDEAGLLKWTRQMHAPLNDAEVTDLADEYVLKIDGTIVHRVWLADEPKIEDDTIARTSALLIRFDPKPRALTVSSFNAGELRLRSFPREKTLYRVEAEYAARANQPLGVATQMRLADDGAK
jgi:hypothetical protein